jgi:hypothetical protein
LPIICKETHYKPSLRFGISIDRMTTVIVTNIAPGTSESTITEFFGFCGRIVNIRLEEGESSMTAYITFETANAANTSLLLANAMIADRAIQVTMDPNAAPAATASEATGEFPAYPSGQEEHGEGASLTGGATRAEPNAATRAIAQLMATGHKLSDTALAEARALDAKWGVSTSLETGLGEVKSALTGFSERIGLTEKAQAAVGAVGAQAQATGIPERASQAAAATEGWFSNIARQASATLQSVAQTGAQWAEENLPTAVAKLRDAGTAMGQQAEAIRVEAHQLYPGASPDTHDAAPEASPAHSMDLDEPQLPDPAPSVPVDANGTPSIL